MFQFKSTRTLLQAALIGAMSTTALAEAGGEAVLSIDGEEATFPLWVSQSDWRGGGGITSVSIYTRANEEAHDRFRSFLLAFEGNFENQFSLEASLTRVVSEDEFERLYSDPDEGGLSISIENSSYEGEFLALTGTVEGMFGPSDNFGRDIDYSTPVMVEGRFDVTIAPLE